MRTLSYARPLTPLPRHSGLPLTVRHTGLAGLTAALRDLVQA